MAGRGGRQPQMSAFVWSSKHADASQTAERLFCACLSLRFSYGTRGVSSEVFGEQELLFCYMFPCLT